MGSKKKIFDAIIVGGGHNGLVAACYLAKAGRSVGVFERRHLVGGAAITEEIFPGYKFSRCSYVNSLFRPQIIEDLQLRNHGYKVLRRQPCSSFTPLLNGGYLLMGEDDDFNCKQIAKFSKADAENYKRYDALMERLVNYIVPLLDRPPPFTQPFSQMNFQDFKELVQLAWSTAQLGTDLPHLYEIMTAPALKVLKQYFTSEPLLSTLATDAIIGAHLCPDSPGSGYVLFHHVMGETDGIRGAWGYQVGGMGALSESLASSARSLGVEIFTEAPVKHIQVNPMDGNRVQGICLQNGDEYKSKVILSSASPRTTFLNLCTNKGSKVPYLEDTDFLTRIKGNDTFSPVTKINLSMDRLPQFKCMKNVTEPIEKVGQYTGTIHFVENCKQVDVAYEDLEHRQEASKRPVIEMTIPSSLDHTLAPKGKHVASMFVQYTPKHLDGDKFADRCFDLVEEYAPGFKSSVINREVLTPADIERVFDLPDGNIFQSGMGLDQLFWSRPVTGHARYETPVPGLFLAGAGAYPGGGVMGSNGRNCAKVVLQKTKK